MVNAIREKEKRETRTLFAVNGIDLDHEEYKSKYKDIQKRADAKRQGMVNDEDDDNKLDIFNAENSSLLDLGIEIEVEGE